MGLERLFVSVGGDISGLEKAFADVGKNIEKIGKNIEGFGKNLSKNLTAPIVAAGAAIVGLATASGAYADRIIDLTDITGMSASAIQEWQGVAGVAGVSTEAVTNAVEGLVKRIPQLEKEGGPATEAINKLGLSFDDLKNLAPDDLIDTLVQRLDGLENPIERNAVASQLFGGAWKDLAPILGLGAKRINEIRTATKENILSDEQLKNANNFRAAMAELFNTFKLLSVQLGAELAPVLTGTFIPIIQDTIIPAVKSVISTIVELINIFAELPQGVQIAIIAGSGFVAALGPVLIIIGKIVAVLGSAVTALAPFAAALVAIATGPIAAIIAGIAALIAVGFKLVQNWDTIKSLADDLISKLRDMITNGWNFFRDNFIAAANAVISVFVVLWEQIKSGISAITDGLKAVQQIIVNFVKSVINGVKSGFSAVGRALVAPFEAAGKRISDITARARQAMNKLNPFHRESPSLVDNVRAGIKEIQDQYKLVAEIDVQRPDLDLSADTIRAVAAESGSDSLDGGALNLLVLDDVALRKLQRALARTGLDESLRLAGI